MTRKKSNRTTDEIKAMMAEDGEFLRPMVRTVIQEFLEAEMSETIGAQKGERTEGRLGYRSGYYPRSLITRVGKLELRIPHNRPFEPRVVVADGEDHRRSPALSHSGRPGSDRDIRTPVRNALDYLPRKVTDDCLVELRWLYDRRNAEEARRDPLPSSARGHRHRLGRPAPSARSGDG